MESMGINYGYLIVQLVNFTICFGWLALTIYTLFALRRQKLNSTTQALWVLIVLAAPLIGSIAFWISKPAGETTLT